MGAVDMGRRAQVVLLAVLGVLTLTLYVYVILRQPSEPSDGAIPPPAPSSSSTPVAGPTSVLVIGDSYAAGTGASKPERSWVSLLADAEGWTVTNDARGGTGYLNEVTANAKLACGRKFCPNYGDVLALASGEDPDVVLVSGGRNDLSHELPSVRAAVTAFYHAARKTFPDAEVLAVSPLWDDDPAPPVLADLAQAVRAAVAETGATYLDVGQPLRSHTGMVVADGVHPDDKGHEAIFRAVEAALSGG